MKLFLGVVVALTACGKVEDPHHLADAPPAPDDVRVDAPADAMADAPPPRCDPAKPFGAPVAITELNSTMDDLGMALTSDELTAVFGSTRSGGPGDTDIYITTRATRTAAWGAPVLLAGVNTAGREASPSISGDGLTIYASYRPNANAAFDVVRSTRSSVTAAFPALAPISGIDTTSNDQSPSITPDQSALYFESDRITAGSTDLYVASGTAGSFAAPAPVSGTSLNTTSNEVDPTITPDQLTLYFASDRGGMSNDIWVATRASQATAFGAPLNLSVLNTTSIEGPDWVSADNCVLYMHRNVGVAASNYDLYVATKPL